MESNKSKVMNTANKNEKASTDFQESKGATARSSLNKGDPHETL